VGELRYELAWGKLPMGLAVVSVSFGDKTYCCSTPSSQKHFSFLLFQLQILSFARASLVWWWHSIAQRPGSQRCKDCQMRQL
jgi:hypothetical protein